MLVQDFKDYLQETLGIQTQPMPWNNAKALPFLLLDRYEFFDVSLLKTHCLLMTPKGDEEVTSTVIRKHLEMAKEKWTKDVIYVSKSLSPINRKRLIEHKVPFVVPGNQLYLPNMGMDLREHFKKNHSAPETYSPATQVIVLDALVHGYKEPLNVRKLAKKLEYSPMTLTRALNEIEKTGVGTVQIIGRERKLKFDLSKRALWEKALKYLQTPVKSRNLIYDKNYKPGSEKIKAGLYALAQYSNLAESKEKIYALSSGQYNSLKNKNELLNSNDESAPMTWLEIWSYDPKRLSQDGLADPFSLYLSLRSEGEIDERVHSALEQMMENHAW